MEQTTIKALASEIGVSKVAVSKKIESLGLKGELIADGKRFLVPPSVAEKVIESYRTRTEEMKGKTSADEDRPKRAEENPGFASTVELMNQQIESLNKQIESLKQQLETKDRQIEKFQEDSKGFLSVILSQQQQLMLNHPDAVVDAEEVGHEESTSVDAEVSDPDRKEPIWAFVGKLFR